MNAIKDDIVMMDSINQFAAAISAWHKRQVDTLEHMKAIPDGSQVCFDEGVVSTLTGDLLKGFVMGIDVSLMNLGVLPFFSEVTDTAPVDGATDDLFH